MKKILVVDDEKDIRDLLKTRLAQSNYAVLTAGSGKEALEVCRNNSPDLILLDIVMQDMDGYQTCERLKADDRLKNIPVLFLTGKDLESQGIASRCYDLSAHGYISKMSSLKEMQEKIRQVLFVEPKE